MGATGVPHDNAVTESVMATIKKECVHRRRFKTRDEARFAIFSYIESFYDPHRRHASLGNSSPAEFERRLEHFQLHPLFDRVSSHETSLPSAPTRGHLCPAGPCCHGSYSSGM